MVATLRETNKERTRVAIVRSALRLFIDNGYEQTTLPMIAAEAGVSTRTVSTYFPVKADIALGPLEQIFRRLRSCLHERPAGESTLDAVERWMRGEAEIGDETGQNLVRRAMARNPVLQVSERDRMIGAERLVADSLVEEHGLPVGDVVARVLASAVIAMTFELWGHKHVVEPGRSPVHISDRADLIPDVVRMLRAAEASIPGVRDDAGRQAVDLAEPAAAG